MNHNRFRRFLADGILVIEKPIGPTSHDIVKILRKHFNPVKLGHTGTLDPFASGVLVIAFNQATRLTSFLGAGIKIYRTILALGQATATGDYTGSVITEAFVPEISLKQAKETLIGLLGEHQQSPPFYSAVKHQGRPLYTYARQGIKINKPPRVITIYKTNLISLISGELEFEIICSRGTYIRVLGESLARALGSVGHLRMLRRLESSPFNEKEAITLEDMLTWTYSDLERRLISPQEALARCGISAIKLDNELIRRIRCGQKLPLENLLGRGQINLMNSPFIMVVSFEGQLVAVLQWVSKPGLKSGYNYDIIRVFHDSIYVQENENFYTGFLA